MEFKLIASSFNKPEGIGGSKKEDAAPPEEENPLDSGVGRLLFECFCKSMGVGVEGECNDVLH